MAAASCNASSSEELVPFASLPQPELEKLIAGCPDVCLLVFGNGNPDLAGIGVVASYAMQLGLAMLFGPWVFTEVYFIPAFWRAYKPSFITRWLRTDQITSLWCHLLFSLTMGLACCIRQYQRQCPRYEAGAIVNVVSVTYLSLIFVMSTISRRIKRAWLFGFGFLATTALSLVAASAPVWTQDKFDGVLEVCFKVAKDQALPWRNGYILPFKKDVLIPGLLGSLAYVFVLLFIWLYLRARGEGRMEGDKAPKKRVRTWKLRTLVSLALGISIYLLVTAWTCFRTIVKLRETIRMAWSGQTGEDDWGIGQIGALFAWAPLFIELICSPFAVLRSYLLRSSTWFRLKSRRKHARLPDDGIALRAFGHRTEHLSHQRSRSV